MSTAKAIRNLLKEAGNCWYVFAVPSNSVDYKRRVIAVKTVNGVVRVMLMDGRWYNAADFSTFILQ